MSEAPAQLNYFRNLGGTHREAGHYYKRGRVVPSKLNLEVLFNQGSSRHFERVTEEDFKRDQKESGPALKANRMNIVQPTTPLPVPTPATLPGGNAADTLEAMSLKELQSFASEEEIDLKGAKSKEEALKVIRATR